MQDEKPEEMPEEMPMDEAAPDQGDARGFGDTPDPEPETDEQGRVPATEEEQAIYDMVVIRARKMIFGKNKEKILKTLGTAQTPSKGIGQVGSMLMKVIMQSSRDQGREIDPGIAINAGVEIVEDINELAVKNKIFQYESPEEEEEQLAEAMLWGVKYFGDGMIANGEVTPEIQKQAQALATEQIGLENAGPKKKPIAAAVQQEMSGPAQPAQPGGLVAGQMGGM